MKIIFNSTGIYGASCRLFLWGRAITYLRLLQVTEYLYAIIDVYSREVISWNLSNTMAAMFSDSEIAVGQHIKPPLVLKRASEANPVC